MLNDGRMTSGQIAQLTTSHPAPQLGMVTPEEQALAEHDLAEWGTFGMRPLIGAARERKLARVIYNTRLGYTCLACKMGECAN